MTPKILARLVILCVGGGFDTKVLLLASTQLWAGYATGLYSRKTIHAMDHQHR